MPTKKLPRKPSLEHLKAQARDLLGFVRQGEESAIERVNETSSRTHRIDVSKEEHRVFKISDAQRVIAREYGLPSWPKLKREVERRTLTLDEKIVAFVTAATQGRPDQAKALLEDEPRVKGASLYTTSVLGNHDILKTAIQDDPSIAKLQGGPRGNDWTLLHYVSFSCLGTNDVEISKGLTQCARILLEAGADPNASWSSPPWPDAKLRPLYGAAGETNQPEVAKLLIEAGAILNDEESIYHACEHYYLECMEILKDAGAELSSGGDLYGNSPLYFLMGFNAFSGSWKTARQAILWLLAQGVDPNILNMKDKRETALHLAVETRKDTEIVTALLEAGADSNLRRMDGATPYQLAIKFGLSDQANIMRLYGAEEKELDPGDALISACFNENYDEATAILKSNENLLSRLTEEQRKSVGLAAVNNQPKIIELLAKAGFSINFIGTKDWDATPLHWASWHGQWKAVQKLLELGADIELKANPPEDSRVLGWALHGSANCGNDQGDYPSIVQALIAAGCKPQQNQLGFGSEEVDEILLQHL